MSRKTLKPKCSLFDTIEETEVLRQPLHILLQSRQNKRSEGHKTKDFKALLWKGICVFQTQSIYYRSYRAGRRQSASAYAAISKIIALQAIWTKALILGINGLAARAEALAPCGGKPPTRGQI